MQPTQSGEPYAAAHMIERQMLLAQAREKAVRERPAEKTKLRYHYITLSRELGSQGDEIAREVAGPLGWSVIDREIVEYIAKDTHVRQRFVQELDERTQNLAHEAIQRFLRMADGASFGIAEYRESLQKTMAFLAARGAAIIVGRGANFALRGDQRGLHVRIVASENVRTQRLSHRWHVPPAEARWRMEEIDMERRNFIRHHFKQNIDNPGFYDVVFCTDHLTPMQVADSILGILGAPNLKSEGYIQSPQEHAAPQNLASSA